jgi:branched-chain amino acid transport system substrate-binding protein
MKKIFIGLVSLFILTACSGSDYKASVLDAEKAGKAEVIKIGIVAPFSGDASAFGEDMRKIFDYELSKINEKAARDGKKFQLVYEDGKCSGADSVSAFQKLTDVDGIKLIIGGTCSSETLAMAPLAQAKSVLLLSAASSNPDIEKEGEYVFSLSYKDSLVGEGIAKELGKYGKVAIISEQNDYNVGIKKVVLDNLDKNVKVAADETFTKGGNDFRGILEKVAKTKPEALFLNPNVGTTANNLLKQLSEIPSLKDTKLISQVGYLADESRSSATKSAEGMIIIDSPKMTDPEFLKKFDEIVSAKGGINTIGYYFTASTLDDLDIVSTLALEYGDNAAKIKDALRSRTFEGYLGTIHFGQDNFVQNVPVGIYIVKNGKAVYQQ